MKFITNDRRECGDLIMLPQRHEIATSHCSSQQIRRNKADVVRLARLLEVKNVDNKKKGCGRRNSKVFRQKSM